jgi:hypothetical protein
VRQLVELHGGTVQVASPGEGQGATFTVCLPLIKDERQELKFLSFALALSFLSLLGYKFY